MDNTNFILQIITALGFAVTVVIGIKQIQILKKDSRAKFAFEMFKFLSESPHGLSIMHVEGSEDRASKPFSEWDNALLSAADRALEKLEGLAALVKKGSHRSRPYCDDLRKHNTKHFS